MKHMIIAALVALSLLGCTENQRAKSLGGTMTVNLACGQRLVNVTWKNDHLWYLTAPMPVGHTATTSTFHEDSSWGVIKGTVVFTECVK